MKLPATALAVCVLAALGALACSDAELTTAPVSPSFARSGTPLVNSLADPGDGVCTAAECTLREALSDLSRSEIDFAKGLTGTITLDPSAGTLVIAGRFVSITGPSKGITIQRAADDPEFGILRIIAGARVRLERLTLTGGAATGAAFRGGGIEVDGAEASLVNVTVTANRAILGGGIYVDDDATVFLSGTTVSSNSSETHGGGVYNGGQLSLANSWVRNNSAASSGGGIYSLSGDLSVNLSTIHANSALGTNGSFEGGGGIFHIGPGMVEITASTISDNEAPEASGGGVAGINRPDGSIFLRSSTVSRNRAAVYGGGVYLSDASVYAANSTISGNAATFGGGIWGVTNSNIFATGSTVVANAAETGGGIGTLGGGRLDLLRALIALNTASNIEPDVSKAASTDFEGFFNLIGDGTGSGIDDGAGGNIVGTAASPVDPKVGKLAANGGPTQTHALLVGSPALDVASDVFCTPVDQRGVSRPQGTACDIGSYERQVQAKKGKP